MTAITRTSDSLLRSAIRLDGVIVALLGVAMIGAAAAHSTVTGLAAPVEYGVGALSVAYGPVAFWLASRAEVRTTGFVLAAINILTTVGLVALVVTEVAGLPSTGNALALAVGVYTAAIGGLQYVGARRAL